MPDSRPMPIVGRAVHELRVRGADGAYRLFYSLESNEAVFIVHAFKKKTQKTPILEIELARKRLKEMMYGKS